MSFARSCLSIPAVLFACAVGSAGLGGCYDLSSSGPRPEDFSRAPGGSSSQVVQEQSEGHPASPTALDDSSDVLEAVEADLLPVSVANEAVLPAPR